MKTSISLNPRNNGKGNDGHFNAGTELILTAAFVDSVFAILDIDGPVVPGQPIQITVFFWSFGGSHDLGTGCIIKVFFANKELFRFPDDGTYMPYVNNGNKADIGDFNKFIDPPAPLTTLGEALYAFGQKDLRLEITTNGRDAGPYTDTSVLSVIPESVDQSWWSWDGPQSLFKSWKETYTLSGKAINKSSYSAMNFFVILQEVAQDSGDVVLNGNANAQVEAGRTSPSMAFPEISQSWNWLIQGIWAIKGPLSRTFEYEAALILQDVYGNTYPMVLSTDLDVQVDVSARKNELGGAALGAFVSATILSGVAVVFPWVAIAAAAAGITASVLGDQALDPPQPDLQFDSPVIPQVMEMPERFNNDGKARPLFLFYKTVADITYIMKALSDTEGKLMGARIEKNKDGIKTQTSSYKDLVETMTEKAVLLTQLKNEALKSVKESGLYKDERARSMFTGNQEILRANLSKTFRKSGIPNSALKDAFRLYDPGHLSKQFFTEKGFNKLLQVTGINVAKVAFHMKSVSKTVLKGY